MLQRLIRVYTRYLILPLYNNQAILGRQDIAQLISFDCYVQRRDPYHLDEKFRGSLSLKNSDGLQTKTLRRITNQFETTIS